MSFFIGGNFRKKALFIIFIFSAVLFTISPQSANKYTLDDLLKIALENNHQIKASKQNEDISAAKKKQAESAYYPQLSVSASYTYLDQDPLFVMPAFNLSLPELPLLGSLNIEVPEQEMKVMDNQNIHAGVNLLYPLFTGGKINSINKQAEYGYEIAAIESKKTDLQVRHDVKLYYYANILTDNLVTIGEEAYETLQATLELTESLYKNGSGSVTKLDYLKNKVIVENTASIIAELKKNQKTSREALIFSAGGELPENFVIAEDAIPYPDNNNAVEELLSRAFVHNPDWLKILSASKVFEEKINEAKSEYYPKVGLFANLNFLINSYDYGFTNEDNKTMWAVGVGIDYPIFSGFRTNAEVEESELELKKLTEKKSLLHDAIIFQVKEAYYKVISSGEQVLKAGEAKATAAENRELTDRAFQQDMVKAEDLVESQIMEALTKAQYQKALYDNMEALLKLEFLLGNEL